MSYYEDANSWRSDHTKWLKRFFLILPSIGFLVVSVVAIALALALAALSPIKEIRPFVVDYDEEKRAIGILDPDEFDKIRQDILLADTNVGQYVWLAEQRDPGAGMFQALLVRYRSSAQVFKEFEARLQEDYDRIGSSVSNVQLEEVFPLNDERTIYRIQYYTERKTPFGGQCPEKKRHSDDVCIRTERDYYVAQLRYKYTNAPTRLFEKWQNGPGFVVTGFDRHQRLPTQTTFELASAE